MTATQEGNKVFVLDAGSDVAVDGDGVRRQDSHTVRHSRTGDQPSRRHRCKSRTACTSNGMFRSTWTTARS
jgi:hypothetical protein